MLFSNRSFLMPLLLKIIAFVVLVSPVSFIRAQEVVNNAENPVSAISSEEAAEPELTSSTNEGSDVSISGVKSTKQADGTAVITWQTNLQAVGAVTVLYQEGNGYPGQLVQQRLTSGHLSTDHRYVLRGLKPGEYSVVVEVVAANMQYDRFTGTAVIPEVTKQRSPLWFLLTWFVSLSFLITLVVLYEVIRHRSEFSRAIKSLQKKEIPIVAKKAVKKRAATKKTTNKISKKIAPKDVSKS